MENMGGLLQKFKSTKKEAVVEEESPGSSQDFRTVPLQQVDQAREDLRLLHLEKEIVAFALSRFNEAEGEGRITNEEKVLVSKKYSAEMKRLEKMINEKEMIIKLYELEGTQSDLMKIFYDKLDDINREIKSIRTSLDVTP